MASRGGHYDCVVIGAGHNGLITAAYLAKSGKKVAVLERRHVLGGCSTSEELWPGFKVSTASYVVSLLLPEIINDLRLKQNGLKILPRDPASFTPTDDGRYLLLGHDVDSNTREIAKFSQHDAQQYPKYNELLERIAAVVEPILMKTAPDPLPMPKDWRHVSLTKKIRDTSRLWSFYQTFGKLGGEIPEAIELLSGAARPILERWFESEPLRATLATDAIIGAFASISAPGTAYVLLHHVMGEAGGKRGVWGFVEGGMGGIAASLAKTCEEMGVTIVREAPVAKIHTSDGKAQGVELEDGTNYEAKVVASSVDANLTFRKFLSPDQLPADFLRAVSNIDYASASAKINLALAEPPQFTAYPESGLSPIHRGTMHISPTMDYIERAYDDAKYGRPSEEPILEMTMPTSVDKTIAPDGKHILSIFVQYAPYKLRDANWDDIKESFADRCIEKIGQYAPNVPGAVMHRQVLSPLDLERVYGLTGGNIMQGAMNFNQLFAMRPIPGWADHRTPVKGLYLCGAASHPGGGVMGACGKNAAVEILRDF
ncbi:phytoene desaturase family protein [Bremerella sp.]|uniref:phytoene desaturase family protein n=1 Tax=Bremerella sp. TaxID=2795602 RepID=UPI00391BB1C4